MYIQMQCAHTIIDCVHCFVAYMQQYYSISCRHLHFENIMTPACAPPPPPPPSVRIVSTTTTAYENYYYRPEQRSSKMALSSDSDYLLIAEYKEGGGADFIQV